MVVLLFQRTGVWFVNLDPFLPGFAHLFLNSLHKQEPDVFDQIIRDGKREEEREGGISINKGDSSFFQDENHRNRKADGPSRKDVKQSYLA